MNYKTLEEIKLETLNNPTTKRYYRSFDYARAIALTQYLETLASNDTFRIGSIEPLTLFNRDAENMESTKTFTVGMWAGYVLNNTRYYIQMDSNPFFPAYVSRSMQTAGRDYVTTGLIDLNKEFYIDGKTQLYWNAEPETIAQLVENITAAVKKAEKFNYKFHEKMPSYRDDFTDQNIYYMR